MARLNTREDINTSVVGGNGGRGPALETRQVDRCTNNKSAPAVYYATRNCAGCGLTPQAGSGCRKDQDPASKRFAACNMRHIFAPIFHPPSIGGLKTKSCNTVNQPYRNSVMLNSMAQLHKVVKHKSLNDRDLKLLSSGRSRWLVGLTTNRPSYILFDGLG